MTLCHIRIHDELCSRIRMYNYCTTFQRDCCCCLLDSASCYSAHVTQATSITTLLRRKINCVISVITACVVAYNKLLQKRYAFSTAEGKFRPHAQLRHFDRSFHFLKVKSSGTPTHVQKMADAAI